MKRSKSEGLEKINLEGMNRSIILEGSRLVRREDCSSSLDFVLGLA